MAATRNLHSIFGLMATTNEPSQLGMRNFVLETELTYKMLVKYFMR